MQHARVLDLTIGGKAETVLISELQWDHLGSEMIHVDFERVDRNERVKVTVPVKLKNSPEGHRRRRCSTSRCTRCTSSAR